MVSAKPAQGAEPVQCSGAAKIKPPFEMGVDNFGFSSLIAQARQPLAGCISKNA